MAAAQACDTSVGVGPLSRLSLSRVMFRTAPLSCVSVAVTCMVSLSMI